MLMLLPMSLSLSLYPETKEAIQFSIVYISHHHNRFLNLIDIFANRSPINVCDNIDYKWIIN